jgi:uncharacterized membrane protein (DUF441 family)
MHHHQLLARWNLGVVVLTLGVVKKCCIGKKTGKKLIRAWKKIIAFVVA